MLTYDDGSRYVYENKQNHDKMAGEMSDIFGKVTRFLQKITDFEGQYAVFRRFRRVLEGITQVVPDFLVGKESRIRPFVAKPPTDGLTHALPERVLIFCAGVGLK